MTARTTTHAAQATATLAVLEATRRPLTAAQVANEMRLEQIAEERNHERRWRHLSDREQQDRENEYEGWLDR